MMWTYSVKYKDWEFRSNEIMTMEGILTVIAQRMLDAEKHNNVISWTIYPA